ncbi:putative solute:sodium symporter small subunit [Alkalispirillum mobile]|uniref:Putative solute:sodium symporter small subunit n=1 Tax=Alkalispirillum mobile TaxID=85925 RepID=A0A498C6B1_9GAMM|nr:DUF4212 domain-containing protein [Alkalispirillum mobile]RLK50893.1 putative solute:sodium symporter small subunit [Alkalispirillum mobile]
MSDSENQVTKDRGEYWRANLRIIGGCLVVWAVVGLGLGVLLADWLNNFSIGGYPLGFWVAQQGSIYTFLVIIFFYAWRMNKLDREYDVYED